MALNPKKRQKALQRKTAKRKQKQTMIKQLARLDKRRWLILPKRQEG